MNRSPVAFAAGRIIRNWITQYRVWRTALDWTVWLYFIIPGLFFAVGTYRDWWHAPPTLLLGMPDGLAPILPLLLTLTGSLRLFVEEADMLFLRQRFSWLKTSMGFGLLYTLLIHLLVIVMLFCLMAVWLVQVLDLSGWQLMLWAAFTAACRFVFAVANHLNGARRKGWRKIVAWCMAAAVMTAVYAMPVYTFLETRETVWLLVANPIAWAAVPLAMAIKLRAQDTFLHDVEMELKTRLASTRLLFMAVTERKPENPFSKPLLFRRSGRIFRRSDAGTMLAEMRIKVFLRSLQDVRLLFSFFSISTVAVLLSPKWLVVLLVVVLPLIPALWVHEQWKAWLATPFVAQFAWKEKDLRTGASISRYWLLAGGVAWLFAVGGWQWFGLWGALAALPFGLLYCHLLNSMLSEILRPGPAN